MDRARANMDPIVVVFVVVVIYVYDDAVQTPVVAIHPDVAVTVFLLLRCIYRRAKTPQKSRKDMEMPTVKRDGKFSGENTLVSKN
jgi:hypothetical protein